MPAPLISTTLPKYMKSKKKAVCVFAAVICAMHVYNSLRVKHNLLKCALVHPKFSPWAKLLNCGDEGSFMTLTGMNFQSSPLLDSDASHAVDRIVKFNFLCIHSWCEPKQKYTSQQLFVSQ